MAATNVQQLQGTWNRIRGQVKEKWGNLTDDDLTVHDGNMDQVIGKIQQKTGESREAIEEFLNKLTSKGASAVSQATEAVGHYAQQAGQYAQQTGQHIRDQYQNVAEQAGHGYDRAQSVVRSNPTQSVAVAFGIGLGLGVMVGLAMRSR